MTEGLPLLLSLLLSHWGSLKQLSCHKKTQSLVNFIAVIQLFFLKWKHFMKLQATHINRRVTCSSDKKTPILSESTQHPKSSLSEHFSEWIQRMIYCWGMVGFGLKAN